MRRTLHFEQKAMATLFEGWLCGEDLGHLRAVAQVLQEEILRIEQLLSKYDPSAEIYRLNESPTSQPIKIEQEMGKVLENCVRWYERTDGFFDIGISASEKGYLGVKQALRLNANRTQLTFTQATVSLDLGGYGKGYALDKLAEILDEFGVTDFLIHGGRSSFLAKGKKANDTNWQVQLPQEAENQAYPLSGGLSFSSVQDRVQGISDIVHAQIGKPLNNPLACAVFASNALEAEVLSTALLAMGKAQGMAFMQRSFPDFTVQFIEKQAHGA